MEENLLNDLLSDQEGLDLLDDTGRARRQDSFGSPPVTTQGSASSATNTSVPDKDPDAVTNRCGSGAFDGGAGFGSETRQHTTAGSDLPARGVVHPAPGKRRALANCRVASEWTACCAS